MALKQIGISSYAVCFKKSHVLPFIVVFLLWFAITQFYTCIHIQYIPRSMHTVFALLCFVVVKHWLIFPYPSGLLHWHCGNLAIDPSASKATLMKMDKYFMWIHYERLHNHNKAKHNKTVCIFLGKYCIPGLLQWHRGNLADCSEPINLHWKLCENGSYQSTWINDIAPKIKYNKTVSIFDGIYWICLSDEWDEGNDRQGRQINIAVISWSDR